MAERWKDAVIPIHVSRDGAAMESVHHSFVLNSNIIKTNYLKQIT